MVPELLSPPVEKLEDLVNHTIVTIAVREGKLHMYPRRAEDVVTYASEDPAIASPEKPREVRWVVRGKAPDQTIRIKAKQPGSGVFPRDLYEISGSNNTAATGSSAKPPSHGHGHVWSYAIELWRGKDLLDVIDPDVVVKSDP